jgi:hypothetical protein
MRMHAHSRNDAPEAAADVRYMGDCPALRWKGKGAVVQMRTASTRVA